MAEISSNEALFWRIAEPLLADGRLERGSLMGFDCVRSSGQFVATTDRKTGDMIVKLTAPRVTELVVSGVGRPFAPAGRVFKEWVAIPNPDVWPDCLDEALQIRHNPGK